MFEQTNERQLCTGTRNVFPEMIPICTVQYHALPSQQNVTFGQFLCVPVPGTVQSIRYIEKYVPVRYMPSEIRKNILWREDRVAQSLTDYHSGLLLLS